MRWMQCIITLLTDQNCLVASPWLVHDDELTLGAMLHACKHETSMQTCRPGVGYSPRLAAGFYPLRIEQAYEAC